MTVRTNRISELLQIGEKDNSDGDYDYTQGFFDAELAYNWNDGFFNDKLYIWEWIYWPEIVDYAKSLGIQIPEDPQIDLSKTF